MKKKCVLAGSLILVMFSLAAVSGCGGDSTEPTDEGGSSGPTKVSIGTQAWIGYGPLWIADKKGFDLDHGVDIDLVNFSTDQDLETGFASEKFQAASGALNTWIRNASLGIESTSVLMEDFSLDADAILSCDPEIKSINDLEGAEVAFEEFSVSDILFRYALKQAGIDFDTIKYTPIPATDAGTAAAAGRVQVAVTYEPYLQAAVRESNCKIIYTAKERPGLISDSLAFTTGFEESNPDAVVGVIKAWGDAVDFYNSNTKEAQAIIAKAVGEKPAELAPSFNGIRLFDLEQSHDFLVNKFPSLWDEIAEIMVEQGQIEEVPDVEESLSTEFGEQALRDEG